MRFLCTCMHTSASSEVCEPHTWRLAAMMFGSATGLVSASGGRGARSTGSLAWSGGSLCALGGRGCACHARNSTRVAALSVALSPRCHSSSLCVRVCSSSSR